MLNRYKMLDLNNVLASNIDSKDTIKTLDIQQIQKNCLTGVACLMTLWAEQILNAQQTLETEYIIIKC